MQRVEWRRQNEEEKEARRRREQYEQLHVDHWFGDDTSCAEPSDVPRAQREAPPPPIAPPPAAAASRAMTHAATTAAQANQPDTDAPSRTLTHLPISVGAMSAWPTLEHIAASSRHTPPRPATTTAERSQVQQTATAAPNTMRAVDKQAAAELRAQATIDLTRDDDNTHVQGNTSSGGKRSTAAGSSGDRLHVHGRSAEPVWRLNPPAPYSLQPRSHRPGLISIQPSSAKHLCSSHQTAPPHQVPPRSAAVNVAHHGDDVSSTAPTQETPPCFSSPPPHQPAHVTSRSASPSGAYSGLTPVVQDECKSDELEREAEEVEEEDAEDGSLHTRPSTRQRDGNTDTGARGEQGLARRSLCSTSAEPNDVHLDRVPCQWLEYSSIISCKTRPAQYNKVQRDFFVVEEHEGRARCSDGHGTCTYGDLCRRHARYLLGVEVKRSLEPHGGMGLHATWNFPRGAVICEYKGVIRLQRDDDDDEVAEGKYAIDLPQPLPKRAGRPPPGTRFVIDAPRSTDCFARYLNDRTLGLPIGKSQKGANKDGHKTPNNCEFAKGLDLGLGTYRVYVCATRDIEAGEELTASYGRGYWVHLRGSAISSLQRAADGPSVVSPPPLAARVGQAVLLLLCSCWVCACVCAVCAVMYVRSFQRSQRAARPVPVSALLTQHVQWHVRSARPH